MRGLLGRAGFWGVLRGGGAGGQGMGGVALEEGQSEGAPETDYGKKQEIIQNDRKNWKLLESFKEKLRKLRQKGGENL